jgi:uncharacterized membrane protein
MSRRKRKNTLSSTTAGRPQNTNPINPQLQNVVRQVVLQQLYQGPLPHPDMLAKYETLYPGASKLLFDQFQEQGKHRMQLENRVIESNIKNSRLGQWMGFSICMVALLGGVILVCFGIRLEGIIAAVAGLAVLVGVFVTGKFTGQKEIKAKRQGQ